MVNEAAQGALSTARFGAAAQKSPGFPWAPLQPDLTVCEGKGTQPEHGCVQRVWCCSRFLSVHPCKMCSSSSNVDNSLEAVPNKCKTFLPCKAAFASLISAKPKPCSKRHVLQAEVSFLGRTSTSKAKTQQLHGELPAGSGNPHHQPVQ